MKQSTNDVVSHRRRRTSSKLSVGEVAKEVGISVQAIRLYERKGLIPEPDRTAGGYRMYSKADVLSLRFIAGAKACGFTLREIRELTDLRSSELASCGDVRDRAIVKLKEIEDRLMHLKRLHEQVAQIVSNCPPGERGVDKCNIIRDIEHLQDAAE